MAESEEICKESCVCVETYACIRVGDQEIHLNDLGVYALYDTLGEYIEDLESTTECNYDEEEYLDGCDPEDCGCDCDLGCDNCVGDLDVADVAQIISQVEKALEEAQGPSTNLFYIITKLQEQEEEIAKKKE